MGIDSMYYVKPVVKCSKSDYLNSFNLFALMDNSRKKSIFILLLSKIFFVMIIFGTTTKLVMATTPTVTSSLSPEVVYVGETFTYSWSSTNATKCISGNGAERATSGSVEITRVKVGGFTSSITCIGQGGETESLASGEVINTSYPLPADPGVVGNMTIQGVDSNTNNIRDDVERKIVFQYPDNQNKRDYSFELAKSYQLIIENSQNSSTVSGARARIYQIGSCLKQEGAPGRDFVLPIVMNTDARTEAYIASMQLGAGEIKSTSHLKECGE